MEFSFKDQELFPAIRFNLLLFKGKSKRISTTIGARRAAFKRTFEIKRNKNASKSKLSAFASLRD
ncbi:hypothetical protein BXU01_17355 [[Flexibacter] sp. ATCC 35103]|nr:hypothetical protein BXU01_17355 [[Flexibacter] sp. ATCC 35103]